ncbi:unnamed protein product [Blepharisma stoltei]|uniref:Uncharacterized protein n=1 Tax=Blepharisma stoltei TaxID=1481888 RepID=A0AAU9JSJ5_9CILI|nr:unnamed protein product [Blepharisma stoltei]
MIKNSEKHQKRPDRNSINEVVSNLQARIVALQNQYLNFVSFCVEMIKNHRLNVDHTLRLEPNTPRNLFDILAREGELLEQSLKAAGNMNTKMFEGKEFQKAFEQAQTDVLKILTEDMPKSYQKAYIHGIFNSLADICISQNRTRSFDSDLRQNLKESENKISQLMAELREVKEESRKKDIHVELMQEEIEKSNQTVKVYQTKISELSAKLMSKEDEIKLLMENTEKREEEDFGKSLNRLRKFRSPDGLDYRKTFSDTYEFQQDSIKNNEDLKRENSLLKERLLKVTKERDKYKNSNKSKEFDDYKIFYENLAEKLSELSIAIDKFIENSRYLYDPSAQAQITSFSNEYSEIMKKIIEIIRSKTKHKPRSSSPSKNKEIQLKIPNSQQGFESECTPTKDFGDLENEHKLIVERFMFEIKQLTDKNNILTRENENLKNKRNASQSKQREENLFTESQNSFDKNRAKRDFKAKEMTVLFEKEEEIKRLKAVIQYFEYKNKKPELRIQSEGKIKIDQPYRTQNVLEHIRKQLNDKEKENLILLDDINQARGQVRELEEMQNFKEKSFATIKENYEKMLSLNENAGKVASNYATTMADLTDKLENEKKNTLELKQIIELAKENKEKLESSIKFLNAKYNTEKEFYQKSLDEDEKKIKELSAIILEMKNFADLTEKYRAENIFYEKSLKENEAKIYEMEVTIENFEKNKKAAADDLKKLQIINNGLISEVKSLNLKYEFLKLKNEESIKKNQEAPKPQSLTIEKINTIDIGEEKYSTTDQATSLSSIFIKDNDFEEAHIKNLIISFFDDFHEKLKLKAFVENSIYQQLAKIENLTIKLLSIKEKMINKDKIISEFKENIKILENKLEISQLSCMKLEKEKNELNSEIDHLSHIYTSKIRENEDINKSLGSLRIENNTMKSELTKIAEENIKFKDENKNLQILNEKLNSEISKLKENSIEINNQSQKLAKELKNSEINFKLIEHEKENWKQKFEQKSTEYECLLQTSEQEKEKMLVELSNLKQSHMDENLQLKKNNEDLIFENSRLQSEIKKIDQQYEALKSHSNHEENKEKHDKKEQEIRTTIISIEGKNKQIASLLEENSKLKLKIHFLSEVPDKELRERLAVLTNRNRDLEQIIQNRSVDENATEIRKMKEIFTKQIEILTRDCETSQKLLQEANKRTVQETAELHKIIEKLTKELAVKQVQLTHKAADGCNIIAVYKKVKHENQVWFLAKIEQQSELLWLKQNEVDKKEADFIDYCKDYELLYEELMSKYENALKEVAFLEKEYLKAKLLVDKIEENLEEQNCIKGFLNIKKIVEDNKTSEEIPEVLPTPRNYQPSALTNRSDPSNTLEQVINQLKSPRIVVDETDIISLQQEFSNVVGDESIFNASSKSSSLISDNSLSEDLQKIIQEKNEELLDKEEKLKDYEEQIQKLKSQLKN